MFDAQEEREEARLPEQQAATADVLWFEAANSLSEASMGAAAAIGFI